MDEAVSEDGVADLLVDLVQRLHLVRRDCTLLSEFSSRRRKARQNLYCTKQEQECVPT
jgi:hypothetical protein